MESLNLNTLASSLPTAYQNAEKELMTDFKAAALSITTLYRSSRNASKRAYNAGYSAACHDLLMMIQQGVSVGGIATSGYSQDGTDPGMTIGRVMDWIEARLEAIKSREEEEVEDEEKEKERERGIQSVSAEAKPGRATKPAPSAAATGSPQPREQIIPNLPTPNSPSRTSLPMDPPSPSPPPNTLRPIPHPHVSKRPSKPRLKDTTDTNTTSPFTDRLPTSLPSMVGSAENPIPIGAGAKRRHAVMMMLDSMSSPTTINASSPSGACLVASSPANMVHGQVTNHPSVTPTHRRRTRSSKNVSLQQNQNLNLVQATEAMDVEEDSGRERKRVSRR